MSSKVRDSDLRRRGLGEASAESGKFTVVDSPKQPFHGLKVCPDEVYLVQLNI